MPISASKETSFSFVFNDRFRGLLERDYSELKNLDPSLSPKSVLVLSGSIIEGLLSDTILRGSKLTLAKINNMSFETLIDESKELGVLSKTDLPTVVRTYRNLVHPAREVIDNVEFDDSDASLARSAVELIHREVKRWANYFRILEVLSPEEAGFLSLFQQASPVGSKYEHPWLSAGLYHARYALAEKQIIFFENEFEKSAEFTQKESLYPEAVKYLESILFKSKTLRTSLILNLRNIESNICSGGGAQGSLR